MPVKRSTIYLLPYRDRVLELTEADKRRFKKLLEPREGCSIWKGSVGKWGYGLFWVPKYKLMVLAHRVAWVFAGNRLTKDAPFVLHDCPEFDDKLCCASEHLWAGTNGDNLRDFAWKRNHSRELFKGWPQRSKPETQKSKPPITDKEVKLLGLTRRPTIAEVLGRKRGSYHKRTYAEIREANRQARLAKKHQREMDKLQRRREREAREERARVRRERREVLGY